MNIIVHRPETPLAEQELAIQVAQIHAQTVVERLHTGKMTKSEKEDLLNEIIRKYQQEPG